MLNLVCHQIQEIFMFQKLVAEPGEKQKKEKKKKRQTKGSALLLGKNSPFNNILISGAIL